jgi:tetratricopeptide (TPR) repeat protein
MLVRPGVLSHAERLWRQAQTVHRQERFREAAELYRQAARAFARGSARWRECRLQEAHCRRMLGQFRLACRLYQSSRQGAEHSLQYADSLVGEAMALRALGELARARTLLQQALRQYRQHGDEHGYAYTLWALGGTLRFLGQFDQALDTLTEALELYQELEDPELSLLFYEQAHRKLEQAGSVFGRAYAACGIANAHRMFRQWEQAHRYFAAAQELYERLGDRVSYAYTLWGEAMAYLLQGERKAARQCLTVAARLFRQTRDRRGFVYVVLARLQCAGSLQAGTPALRSSSSGHSTKQPSVATASKSCIYGSWRPRWG